MYIFAQVLNQNAIIKRIIAKACVDVVVVLSVLLFPKRTTLAEHLADIVIKIVEPPGDCSAEGSERKEVNGVICHHSRCKGTTFILTDQINTQKKIQYYKKTCSHIGSQIVRKLSNHSI